MNTLIQLEYSSEESEINKDFDIKIISMEDIVKSGCVNIDEVIAVIENVLVDYKNGKVMLPDKISQIFDKKLKIELTVCLQHYLMKVFAE